MWELLAQIEVERRTEGVGIVVVVSLAIRPLRMVLRQDIHIATIECVQIVRGGGDLEGDVLRLAVGILQVHRIVGVTEVLLVGVEVVRQAVVEHEGIVVLSDAIVIVAHLDIVVEEELAISLVIFIIGVAIHETRGESRLGIEAHGITRIKRFGDDVDENIDISISGRRRIVVLHLLDFLGRYRLEVVVARHRHIVDENLHLLVDDAACLAGHGVDDDARDIGDEVLGVTGVLHLFLVEGVGGMVTTIGTEVALHHHSLELVGIGLHPDGSDTTDIHQAANGLIAHVAHLYDGLILFARYHEVAIGIAHTTTEEGGIVRIEQLHIGKLHRQVVVVDESAYQLAFALSDALHSNQTVAHHHLHRIEAYHSADGIGNIRSLHILGDGEILQLVVDKAHLVASGSLVEVDEHIRHATVVVVAREMLGTCQGQESDPQEYDE